MKAKISEDQYSNIIELYKEITPITTIAKMYGVGEHAIRNVLEKCNVEFHHKHKKPMFSALQENEIVDLYLSGKTLAELEILYNTSDTTLMSVLDRHGIKRRHRKYSINETYFDEIDTPNKAYILGLLYADGYNNMQNNEVSITLQDIDREILEKINIEIKNETPLRFINNHEININWKNCYQLSICSKHVSNSLAKWGMVQRKSLVLEFPFFLKDSLYAHFLRGYFDGDGHINGKKYGYEMSIIGTKNFIYSVHDILISNGIESHIYQSCPNKNDVTYTLMTTSKDNSIKFADYIYKDAELYINRKHDIYNRKYCA